MPNSMLKGVLLGLAILLAPTSLYADDTEIFFARADADQSKNKNIANVMILLDTSGSMRRCEGGSGATWCGNKDQRRINMLVHAFNTMIDGIPEDVRVGISRFRKGTTDGGHVMVPVIDTTPNNKALLKKAVARLNSKAHDDARSGDPEGGTPTSEAYYEMYRYMMGKTPKYGRYGNESWKDNRKSVCLPSDEVCTERVEIVDGRNYVSPMDRENQCETNHIIIMTDGEPSRGELAPACDSRGWPSVGDSYACQEKIAADLYSKSNPQSRKVRTHNIGLYMSEYKESMDRVSAAGGSGKAYNADTADALAQAFVDQLQLIDEESKAITSPGVAVNQMNRLEHLDQLYYSVFKPRKSSVWEGNLKRYRLDSTVIRDVNNANAVDSDTGYFSNFSKSWWSSETDGFDAEKGGARSQLDSRNLFVDDATGSISELTQGKVDDDNITTNATFGIPADARASWDTKQKVYAALKTQWADPLHSVPLMVNYKGGDAESVSSQTNYIFVSTNGGLLHAINPKDGSEQFAFMPDEFLGKAYDFVSEPPLQPGNIREPYGLDGSWVAWRRPERDSNGDKTGDAKNVYIYGGMRRGGDSYYGLDVSTIGSPEMLWKIKGGYQGSADSNFDLLGQTWSTPTLTQIKIDGTRKPVLVFGGGYSPEDHDEAGQRSNKDDVGRAVYMVDAKTGELVWSASKSASNNGLTHTSVSTMNWAVPGGVSVVDLDFDGYADYLYFADLGGQIFRVNLDNDNDGASNLVEGVTRLASLGGTAKKDHRRFYEAPAVGYKSKGGEALHVVIGSGYRAHPLDEDTDEAVFAIRDSDFRQVGSDSDTITLSDLRKASTNYDPDKAGWYHEFSRAGEKVMSSASILENTILFTTYAPGGKDLESDPCVVRFGEAYLYAADLVTGKPPGESNSSDFGENSVISDLDWSGEKLEQSTIPPSPSVIYQEGGEKVSVVVGTEVVDAPNLRFTNLRKDRWYRMEKDEANHFVSPPTEGN